MPKGRKKGSKQDKYRSTEQPSSSDEDAGIDMTIDNCSEISVQSDSRSNHDEAAAESDLQEKLDEKVLELIDNLTARAAAARVAALASLRSALQRRYLGTLLDNQRATLADLISRAIRKGRDGERKAAAAIAPLLSLQIGEEGSEEFMAEVRPALVATCVDRSASLDTRTECCSSLAVLCYLMEEDITEIVEIMKMYETIFSGSYLKGDGSVKVSGSVIEEGTWHAAAIDGWALLLTLLGPAHARTVLDAMAPEMARLAELMEACSLEVRLAAGSAIAIAHERVTDDSESSTVPAYVERVLPRLTELARDSHKFRAKRDRKLQRATFRDILKYMEEDEVPELAVRVGPECIWCTTWASRAAYAALAGALGGGLSTLAPHVPALRHALGLSQALPTAVPQQKLNKLQRHLQNSAASKARTLARNKSRDKRTAALAV
ncbi:hypothetical protein ABMA27_015093 [Loxostege sticticalis]|uniref:Interferon-related developmental regulator 1 n=1 Tax=Loxostege sticticalis TaxID=481309 RepID=A0ABR3I6D3_LOXSC